MSTTLPTIFLALEQACLAEGGDGDTLLLTPDYKAAANAFEAWLKANSNTWWSRGSQKGFETFHNNQECIYFAADGKERFHASYVVELPYGIELYP
jgi:hypothetical protein